MKKFLIGCVAVVLLLVGAVVSSTQAALTALLAGAAQTSQECRPTHAVLGIAGGPVRVPMVAPYQLTSEYGMRYNPGQINHGQYRLHAGLDFAYVGTSVEVVAVMAGVVTSTPTNATGGKMVWIDHGGGLQTRYLHLSSRTVKTGDTVAAGTPLGIEGSTGNSSGAHLHLEVLQSGTPTDPRQWFAGHGISLPALRVTAQGQAATTGTTPTMTVGAVAPGAPTTDRTTSEVLAQLPAAVGAFRGEQLVNAGHVIKAGQDLGLDAHTITIGVMTAIGESTLVNLDHGDAAGPDSRGLFQQRANGAWGSYTDRTTPYIAATNFYKALIRVPNYRTLEPTIAAHKTQGNDNPYHYARSWGDAVAIVAALTNDPDLLAALPASGSLAGCATPPGTLPPAGTGTGQDIVAAAMAYLGTPYSWGGGSIDGPTTGTYTSASLNGSRTVGFDCSGLVMFAVHRATGITLRHSAEAQAHDTRGTPIPRDLSQMQPGDIIAFSQDGSGRPGTYGHVGIYAGDGRMVHANRPGVPLEVIDLAGSRYFQNMYWSIRRYV